jgi:pimeloyl-ACP methyl ester carboxylesterase
MVHGFQTPLADGERDFGTIAERVRKEGTQAGLRTSIIGVHWDSGSNEVAKWFPKAVGSRITSLLGLKHAVKNPYLAKMEEARNIGRTGFRAVVLRLQEAAPEAPVHLLAHSMGAEVVVAGLAPEARLGEKSAEQPAIQRPNDVLRVGMVTLVGADLDYDHFCRDQSSGLERALGRAQVWWITVPKDQRADGMLELRKGAGRGDAVGNRGLKLCQDDLNRLLRRRALVIDMGNVPTKHEFTDYLGEERVRALVASMLYLENPQAPAARTSVLAALDEVLNADPATLQVAAKGDPCLRLYTAWRTNAGTSRYPAVAVTREGASSTKSELGERTETLVGMGR